MPLPGGFGGMDLQRLTDLMQQPGMQQAMQGLMSSPGIMDSIAATNPQMRQMLDANPQLRCLHAPPQHPPMPCQHACPLRTMGAGRAQLLRCIASLGMFQQPCPLEVCQLASRPWCT